MALHEHLGDAERGRDIFNPAAAEIEQFVRQRVVRNSLAREAGKRGVIMARECQASTREANLRPTLHPDPEGKHEPALR
jgi:hypothetical protein